MELASGMSLEEPGWLHVNLVLSICLPNQGLVSVPTRVRQARSPSILIQPGRANHGPNRVPVLNRVAEPLDDGDSKALASCIAVRPFVKTPTARVGREETHVAHHHHVVRMVYEVAATNETLGQTICAVSMRCIPYTFVAIHDSSPKEYITYHVCDPIAQVLASQVQSRYTRRTRGVKVEAGPRQVEEPTDPVRQD